ncbi:MAG: hypothetical protein QOD99_672 [Chthoniobacter sp.]|nr:hypothetical protein [Chthoniobacter sp.]
MEKTPADFDLKLMPDWLKEGPVKNPYANYEVAEERPRRDFGERSRGGARPGGPQKPRGDKGRPPHKDRRTDFPRPQGPAPRREEQAPRTFTEQAPAVKIEFVPEPVFIESVARQVKTTNRAYPIFELARMFLEKPQRHRVRVCALSESQPLFQLGENGPVALDVATLERTAFHALKADFYTEEKTQSEPPKGNFANVARCRLTGTLLGPTNHHGYQSALRKLYEERFSRRMPYADFLREIETVTDPAAIEAWKENARSATVFKTVGEGEPLTFASTSEAEEHFRKSHLPQLIRTTASAELPGETSRALADRRIAAAVRQAWEKERAFPAQLMFHLRQQLGATGLQFFKHRKRMQFVTAIRPTPFKDGSFAPNIAEIIRLIQATPRCTRAELASGILKAKEGDTDPAALKTALASDLRWLIDAGRVIEFHDGHFELPFAGVEARPEHRPRPKPEPALPAATPPSETSPESLNG